MLRVPNENNQDLASNPAVVNDAESEGYDEDQDEKSREQRLLRSSSG
jgi:hypothetical protein